MSHACAASKSMRAATRDMLPSWLGVIHLRLMPSIKDAFWTGRDPVLDPANLGQWPADVYTDEDHTPIVRQLLAQCTAWPNINFVLNVQEATPLPRLRRWVLVDPPANLLGVGILHPDASLNRRRKAEPASWRRSSFRSGAGVFFWGRIGVGGDGDEQPPQPPQPGAPGIVARGRPSGGGSMTLADCFGMKHFLDADHDDAWIRIADFETLGRLDLDMHVMP